MLLTNIESYTPSLTTPINIDIFGIINPNYVGSENTGYVNIAVKNATSDSFIESDKST